MGPGIGFLLSALGGGVACLGILAAAIWIGWKIFKRKLKLAFCGVPGASPLPMRISLRPARGTGAVSKDMEQGRAELAAAGFVPAGRFEVPEIASMDIEAFVHASGETCAVLYEHPEAGFSGDVVWFAADADLSITVTSATMGGELLVPPWARRVRMPKAPVAELAARMASEAKPCAARRVSAENFVPLFEESYAREMDFHALRGGPQEDEIRRCAESAKLRLSRKEFAAAVEVIRKQWAGQLAIGAQEEFARIARQRGESPDPERLTAVHDRLTGEEVLEILRAAGVDVASLPQGDAGRTPRAAVAKWLPSAAEGRVQRLGEVARPLPADIYAITPAPEPEEAEDEDDERAPAAT